jgi:thiol-disulfide isomerase/thioredoxin
MRTIPIELTLAVTLASVAACGGERYGPLRTGDAAPVFEARALDGQPVQIGGPKGSPILVNVWATWCIPCREEMPALQALHERLGEPDLRVVGVNIDTGGDGPVLAFLEEHGITYVNLRDPGDRITPAYRLVGVPETILIDGAGRVVYRWIGRFDPLSEEALRIIHNSMADSADSQVSRR